MALLDMCIQKGMSIFVAHVNYHHRKEADEEERYVVSYCKERDIPVSVRNEPFVSHGNFEADARTWRYDFFVKTVKENHLAGVLVAHHMDDLIETYLMMEEKNLEPSYYGLRSEMMYHGILVKRPLLSYTKAQLQKYCDERGIRYYIDSTNLSDEYTRNRIRHSINKAYDPYDNPHGKRNLYQLGKLPGMNRESVLFLNDARFINTARVIKIMAHLDTGDRRFSDIQNRLKAILFQS